MDRFQIVETAGNFNHAGTKATSDIARVAERLGFSSVDVKMNTTKKTKFAKIQRQIGYFKDWNRCYRQISDGSVVLLQHPFHYPQLTRDKILHKLKEKKHVRYISVVHDVEKLRAFRYNDYYRHEFDEMIELADAVIVHNRVMLDYFVKLGVPEKKLVNLEIFDYLQDDLTYSKPSFAREINVAGNLDTVKCKYIRQLGNIGVSVNLYGPNFDETMKDSRNVTYKGSFPASEIPHKLVCGFGLVWDGDSIEGCKGLSGQYLCYNNPHKLSLYLSSGIPVIMWNGAAEASFVRENNVGICVDNLNELSGIFETMTKEEYDNYAESVGAVRSRLVSGYYADRAINKALGIIGADSR